MCTVSALNRIWKDVRVILKSWLAWNWLGKADFQKESGKKKPARCKTGEDVCHKHKMQDVSGEMKHLAQLGISGLRFRLLSDPGLLPLGPNCTLYPHSSEITFGELPPQLLPSGFTAF